MRRKANCIWFSVACCIVVYLAETHSDWQYFFFILYIYIFVVDLWNNGDVWVFCALLLSLNICICALDDGRHVATFILISFFPWLWVLFALLCLHSSFFWSSTAPNPLNFVENYKHLFIKWLPMRSIVISGNVDSLLRGFRYEDDEFGRLSWQLSTHILDSTLKTKTERFIWKCDQI